MNFLNINIRQTQVRLLLKTIQKIWQIREIHFRIINYKTRQINQKVGQAITKTNSAYTIC
jgi:hypothetical protein